MGHLRWCDSCPEEISTGLFRFLSLRSSIPHRRAFPLSRTAERGLGARNEPRTNAGVTWRTDGSHGERFSRCMNSHTSAFRTSSPPSLSLPHALWLSSPPQNFYLSAAAVIVWGKDIYLAWVPESRDVAGVWKWPKGGQRMPLWFPVMRKWLCCSLGLETMKLQKGLPAKKTKGPGGWEKYLFCFKFNLFISLGYWSLWLLYTTIPPLGLNNISDFTRPDKLILYTMKLYYAAAPLWSFILMGCCMERLSEKKIW